MQANSDTTYTITLNEDEARALRLIMDRFTRKGAAIHNYNNYPQSVALAEDFKNILPSY